MEMTQFNATLVTQHTNTQPHTDCVQYMQSLFSHKCLTLKMKTTGKLESQEKVKYIGLLGLNWIAVFLLRVPPSAFRYPITQACTVGRLSQSVDKFSYWCF